MIDRLNCSPLGVGPAGVVVFALTAAACGGGGEDAAGGRAGAADALPPGAEAISLLGDTLYRPDRDSAFVATQEAKLDSARQALATDPGRADELIWVGRRLAYLGRYGDAIATYTRGIELHPDDPRLYRHRGHRYITVRRLDDAVADLSRAGEMVEGTEDVVEPDGLPNERGIPTSTLHFNIWYHLGLAHYLRGDFESAARAYEACLAASKHPDSVVATTYWYFLTLQRLGRPEEAQALLAPIEEGMDLIEAGQYFDLIQLFRGETRPGNLLGPTGDEATLASTTTAYGVGAWHLVGGRRNEAILVFHATLRGRDQWPAFGYIAAEADLSRMLP